MNDDDPWDETPRCVCCGEQLTYHYEVVEICMGELAMGQKSGMPYFSPADAFPDGEEAKYVHMHCLLTRMDFADDMGVGLFRCNLCGDEVTDDPEIYRLRLGKLRDTGDDDYWEFVPQEDDNAMIYLCRTCMTEGLGEGDHTTGYVLLGMV